jgi:hypothetical protein
MHPVDSKPPHAITDEILKSQDILSRFFSPGQLKAMACGALGIALIAAVFIIAAPTHLENENVRFGVCLVLSTCLSIFLFVIWPQILAMNQFPGIDLLVRVSGPVVLWIGLMTFLTHSMPHTGSHWEHFRPQPQDPSLYLPYYKKITIQRKGGGHLEYRIVEEQDNPHWSVFIQFPQTENSIQAELAIPDHKEMSVEFKRGQETFDLPDSGGTRK